MKKSASTQIGIGNPNASIKVYIQNRPPLPNYDDLAIVEALEGGDIATIAQQIGNHWRKIFNVYAKIIFELDVKPFDSWQTLRDNNLLQLGSDQCLMFSPLSISQLPTQAIHIIMGKGYASHLDLSQHCLWLSPDFAINTSLKLIICPYFDYRQLSNIKIIQLVKLVRSLQANSESLARL
jgi:hypothetical protein